jgi:hypothetical protein
MADADLQALLDTTGMGPRIILRANPAADESIHSYFVLGGATYPGIARWVDTADDDTDEEKETAIRAKLLE